MRVDLRRIEHEVHEELPAYLEALRRLVAIDSGSYSPDGVNAVASACGDLLVTDGWTIERRPSPSDRIPAVGDMLIARIDGSGSGRVLLVGHTDTVFPDGTAAARPLVIDEGRALGPGVCDMKGGLLLARWVVRALLRGDRDAFGLITFILNPDEEIGSPISRSLILEEARGHDVALVLESARASGAIVSSRKGVTTGNISIRGRAAHAGVEPDKGRSAVVAAASLDLQMHELNHRWPGTTVNIGTIAGGTRTNVVPAAASLEFEIRSPMGTNLSAAERAIEDLVSKAAADGVFVRTELDHECPPMERSPKVSRLVSLAKGIASELGFALEDEATGGASDANAIAAAGVPVLDGLG